MIWGANRLHRGSLCQGVQNGSCEGGQTSCYSKPTIYFNAEFSSKQTLSKAYVPQKPSTCCNTTSQQNGPPYTTSSHELQTVNTNTAAQTKMEQSVTSHTLKL